MGKIGESLLYVVIGIAIIGLIMFFPSFKSTGNVVADYTYTANVGDSLNYNASIAVPEAGVDSSAPIIMSLSRDGNIIDSKIITMSDFIKLSDSSFSGESVQPGMYEGDISRVIDYKFDKAGEYELYFAIFKLDVIRTIKITVE